MGARLFSDVQTYASLGPHRAGTSGDTATTSWMRGALPPDWKLHDEPVRISRWFDYESCTLLVDGIRHDCFGVWLPNVTAVRDLRVAPASATPRVSLAGRVAIVDVSSPTLGRGAGEAILDAIARGAAAVALVNHLYKADPSQPIPTGGWPLTAINSPAPYNHRAWAVPVAVIGTAARAAMMRPGSIVDQFHVRGRCCVNASSRTLVASLRVGPPPASPSTPSQPSLPPLRLIVSTPTSGWFACGGERGVGVALWLMLARELPDLLSRARAEHTGAVPAVEALLLGTAVHELGFGGATDIIERTLNPLGFSSNATTAWISLGASIITHRYFPGLGVGGGIAAGVPSGTFMANLDYTRADLAPALAPYERVGYRPSLNPPDRRGELLPIAEAGYRAFGFYGEHALFHTPFDDANATSAQLLDLVAAPTLSAVQAIVNDALKVSTTKNNPLRPPEAEAGAAGTRGRSALPIIASFMKAESHPDPPLLLALPSASMLYICAVLVATTGVPLLLLVTSRRGRHSLSLPCTSMH